MMRWRGGAALILCLVLAACGRSSAQAPIAEQWRSISIEAEAVELGVDTVGMLRFRGGLSLTSEDAMFSGISGIEVLDDNRLIAITDNGDWIEARLDLDEAGALIGVGDAQMALMRNEQGEPFPQKAAGDSEDIAQMRDGRFAVAFEQTQSIRIYDLNRDGPFGAAAPGPRLQGVRRLPKNQGLESIVAAENGDLIVAAEGGRGRGVPVWRAPPDAQTRVGAVSRYPLDLGYAVTSLDRLPDGDFVALERFYAPVVGGRARITRFSEADLVERAVQPRELARIEPPLPLDNFEGIAAIEMPNGVTRLYIVSDNNFSTRQRTLLYAFDLVSQAAP